jgi:flagellar biosynthesis component FlhA
MDIVLIVFSVVIVLLLVACLFCLLVYLPKRQENLLKQQKETSNFEETQKTALELREKLEEISKKLLVSEEVNKTLLESVDKGIKGEIINQQKLFQEKNKELSERLNKENKQ